MRCSLISPQQITDNGPEFSPRSGSKIRNVEEGDDETKIQLVSYNVMDVCDSPRYRSMEYPSPEILDQSIGLVISGSACNAYEDITWINQLTKFTRKVIDECTNLRFESGQESIRLGIWDLRNRIKSNRKELFKVDDGILKLHQVHRDIVNELPEGTYNLGTTSICKSKE
ncbi:hypothetical protein PSHT_11060 [Puccinia striiformis]|uniref:Uncharacterized protein n=1 Tax=Puccinia striiformis TaxID=27350 RepID=A0A2S4V5L6_9BASI|nr:hypothetical protein PSHT_11060 [Puccinia striiformis]